MRYRPPVVLKLGGAGERGGVGQRGHPPLLVAAGHVLVDHEADERALQAGAQAAQHVEAALGQLHAAIEVDDVQLGAQVPVGLGLEALGGEVARGAPAAHLGVVVLVGAHRRGGVGHVGDGHQQVAQVGVDGLAARAHIGELVVDGAHALLGGLGLVLLAGAHHLADLLGERVALGLERLLPLDGLAAGLVKLGEAGRVPRCVAVLHGLAHGVQVFADELDV